MRNFSLISIICFLLISCIGKDRKEDIISKENEIQYVINDSLDRDFYKRFDGYVPIDGLVPNADVAVKIAECVLIPIYGEKCIKEQAPYSVNLSDEVWAIEGTLNSNNHEIILGGTFYIEISKKNGGIIKLLHTK